MILVGADPEVFVSQAGKFISGHTIVCGTKEHPSPTRFGAIQNDGLALEFNVHPSDNKERFVSNIEDTVSVLTKYAQEQAPGCMLVIQPTAPFSLEYLESLPDAVKALGCTPDFNAYTEEPNHPPDSKLPMRTGSGHVHVGFTTGANEHGILHFDECCARVKQLDFFLGLASLKWDGDATRRKLYGKAGAFRPKTYGLEYRTLSNMWISDKALMGFVFDQTQKAMDWYDKGVLLDDKYQGFAREMIDKNIVDWAEQYPEIAKEIY